MLALIHSDRAVVRKVLGGNLAAFRVLVDRYGAAVHGVAYARLRNSADAEDVAQETFLRFYQQLDQMAHRRHVGSWLLSVARNVSVDMVRRRLRETERLKPARSRFMCRTPCGRKCTGCFGSDRATGPRCAGGAGFSLLHEEEGAGDRRVARHQNQFAEKRLQRARDELGRRLTEALGNEVDELKADARRVDRIMAAICVAPVA